MQTDATPFLSHSGRETVSPAKESRPKGDCDVPPLETPFVSATVRRTAPYSSAAPCSVAAAASGALSFQNRTRYAGLRFCDRYTGPLAGSTPRDAVDERRRTQGAAGTPTAFPSGGNQKNAGDSRSARVIFNPLAPSRRRRGRARRRCRLAGRGCPPASGAARIPCSPE